MPLLDWLNKDQAVKQVDQVSYRLLQLVAELSVGDPNNENMLIQGSNLEPLKPKRFAHELALHPGIVVGCF